jgi:hypothetical protein
MLDFYHLFTLESGSEISRDPRLAKVAGGKTGVVRRKGEKPVYLRPKSLKTALNPKFFTDNNHNRVMKRAFRAKFSQNDGLRDLLLATKDAKLVHFQRGSEPIVFTHLMEVRRELREAADRAKSRIPSVLE